MFSTKGSKRGIKKVINDSTDNVSNKKAHSDVDDCVSEDNDTDSEEETEDNYFKKSGSYLYGMRVIGYQCLFAAKGSTPVGQPPFMVFFNRKLSDSFSDKTVADKDKYHKKIKVKTIARRKHYPKNVPVEVMDKNGEGQWTQRPQMVYVREVPNGLNTTAGLKQWSKMIANEVKNQGAQYPVDLKFGRDMTVLDGNGKLRSLDTILMDEDVVHLVKKRYKNALKKNNGDAFFCGSKLNNYFEPRHPVAAIRALFG